MMMSAADTNICVALTIEFQVLHTANTHFPPIFIFSFSFYVHDYNTKRVDIATFENLSYIKDI